MSSSVPNGSGEAEEPTVSLDDLNQENRELKALEEDARAVLGNSDAEHCTWDKGYVKRQALYACVTCRPDEKDSSFRAGVCLACSYSCHEDHELVELYTKRDFRCDCGNLKFQTNGGRVTSTCKLAPSKDDYNPNNNYNQNYDGVYCTCGRPYPDPEDPIEDEMIQCVVCEDWYHSRHLLISASFNGGKVPEEYHEMVCQLCSAAHPFLSSYASGSHDSSNAATEDRASSSSHAPSSIASTSVPPASSPSTTVLNGETSRKRKLSGDADSCRWKRSRKNESADVSDNASSSSGAASASSASSCPSSSTALFFAEGWRSTLCTCPACRRMYEEEKVAFLALEEDSVGAYEAAGPTGGVEEEEEAALGSLLGGMDRFQQGELLGGFNDMKTALSEYLRQFAEEGKVVTAEDIRQFFQEMETKKKSKGNPQYHCG